MKSILFQNGRVWDGERFRLADVFVEMDTIARIAERVDEKADYTFDASGKIVAPGLVDLHIHMKGVGSPAFGTQTEMSCLPFGVTAACDCGSEHGSEELMDYCAVDILSFPTVKCREGEFDCAYIEEAIARFGKHVVGLKVYYDRNIKACPDPENLQKICAYAQERGLKIAVHCSNSPTSMLQVVQTLNSGDILTHIYHGGENNCLEDDFAAFRLAREKGIVLDSGFAAHVHTDLDIFPRAVAAGFAPDTVSTDITIASAYTRGGRYGLPMCMSMARTAGMPEEEIFRAVTSTPAKVMGKEGKWGSLYEGGPANIAVLELTDEGFSLLDRYGNRMEDSIGYRCVLTLLDGQIVYRH